MSLYKRAGKKNWWYSIYCGPTKRLLQGKRPANPIY